MIFLVSLLLTVWSSWRWASHLAAYRAEGFWIFVAAVMLQLGTIASLTSLVHQLTPMAWMLVQVLLCAGTLRFTGRLNRPKLDIFPRLRAFAIGLSLWEVLALCGIGVMLVLSMLSQAATPIHGYDEKMYHASRVMYWIQNRSVFPFETHNIRQTMIPFGSELFFLWPVLLTKTEAVGRVVFWSAYPLAAVGQYVLLRAMKLNRTAALVGVVILLSTPLIATSAIGLKPEIWAVVAVLGVAYWAVSLCADASGWKVKCFFLGVFAVLSINIRAFPVAMLPSLLLIMWWAPGGFSFAARSKALAAGLVVAGLFCTLLIPLAFNSARYHHPLGPPEVRRVVQAEIKPDVMYTHAVRFVFLLTELPDVAASAEVRQSFSHWANRLIATFGATTSLSGENDGFWPGKYAYSLPERSTRFSLWGLFWLPTLLLAVPLLVRNVVMTWPRVRLTAVSVQTLLAVPLMIAVLFGARWMAQSDVPGRFLIGPYALLLPIGIAWVAPYVSTRKFAQALVALAVLYAAYQPVRAQAYQAVQAFAAPVSDKAINEPFDEILGSTLPSGARVLFVGHQDAPDYPLFSADTQYSNVVIPWGTATFDPARMRSMIDAHKVTHVLVQDAERAFFQWFPEVDTRPMVRWLAAESAMEPVLVKAPSMRMFAVAGNVAMNERAFRNVEVPAAAPLIVIDDALRSRVGIDPTLPQTPWPVENLGSPEGGFLWMGQGHGEGIEFGLWSRDERDVDIRLQVSAGPGLTTPERRVMLLHDGVPVGDEHVFQDQSSLVLRTRLRPGRNVISFFAVDAATVKSMPNGDTRHLVMGLHEIRIASARESMAAPSASHAAGQGASGTGTSSGVLAHSARKAVGLISRRQQVDGFWTTSYTSDVRFENPKLEMNTFVTSTMVDILGGAQRVPPGLGGSLGRARAHLREQIEPSGLVRYHGRPDAPAMSAFGLCPITPDADDTALVWRIASGVESLRLNALATLMQYRTVEGLYRTWLGQRKDYRCIDPGADPNPTDVAIQMHVLLFLAQADPPAARSLCNALRQVIDQDRVWVYYRRAPLVPVLRQTDLKAAGCDLPLPAARAQTTVEDQKIWLAAGHLLQRLEAGAGQTPSSAEVADLLRALSRDDFAAVKKNPPLLYHNDLTATVRRYYWAEDVGYAIWLKVYLESMRLGLMPDGQEQGHAPAAARAGQKTP